MPSIVPYIRFLPSWFPCWFRLDDCNDLFLIVFANLSSSFLVTTDVDLDRNETVVFRDAKKPETFVTTLHTGYLLSFFWKYRLFYAEALLETSSFFWIISKRLQNKQVNLTQSKLVFFHHALCIDFKNIYPSSIKLYKAISQSFHT